MTVEGFTAGLYLSSLRTPHTVGPIPSILNFAPARLGRLRGCEPEIFGANMSHRLRFVVVLSVFGSGFLANLTGVVAKDYFLTIGGGYDVTGNQISLEKNVLFQQAVLAAQRPDKPPYEVWFADGNDPHPDVQCRDPEFEEKCPVARRMLAEVLGDADSMDLVYRTNEVPGLEGPSDLKAVRERFRKLASEVKPGDRVIIYFAGHGGRAKRPGGGRRTSMPAQNPYNTCFYFWNTEAVTASEFTGWLDRFPRNAEVVLVMVQCYAGGFAHTIFDQADAEKGLSDHERCGFFAQVHDRGAAGCTPDANEADYEEYSSFFWGALAGKSRSGKTVDTADYNKDGQVSFAEAHAYAMIESNTIDVPVRTSGALLRKYSQVGRPTKKRDAGAIANKDENAEANDVEYAEMQGPLATLMEFCRSDRRAILEQLPEKLGLGTQPTVEDVQKRLRGLKDKIATANEKLAAATKTRRDELKKLRTEIYKTWPELRAEYAPLAIELATDRADGFVNRVKGMPDYAALGDAKKMEDSLSKAFLQLEREKAGCERLLETCEDAVLAANLPRVAKPEIVARYEQLLSMEEGTLAESVKSETPPKNQTTASSEQ